MEITGLTWAVTIIAIVALLAFDYIFHVRKAHTPTIKEAAIWSSIYIGLALAFGLVFVFVGDTTHAVQYYTGFLTEKALSVDNLFVFMIIMASFKVPREFQQKVLLFGITFALISRTIFILLGAAIINAWSDVFYIFGLFLIVLAGQQLKSEVSSAEDNTDEANNVMVRTAKKLFAVSDTYDGDKLFTHINTKRMMTPMLLVMIAIGATDILFAFDSIPAIFGISSDPYIVFTATAFSLMGLRQLYFLIDGLLDRVVFLGYGLAAILGFIGVKLILHALSNNHLPFINDGESVPVIEISDVASLLVVATILIATVAISLASPRGQALRALQNAERFAFRYTKLDPNCDTKERRAAEEKMDYWTQRAEAVDFKYLDELIEHKDRWSAIIRVAHETRLKDASSKGEKAPVSEQIVADQGPVLTESEDTRKK